MTTEDFRQRRPPPRPKPNSPRIGESVRSTWGAEQIALGSGLVVILLFLFAFVGWYFLLRDASDPAAELRRRTVNRVELIDYPDRSWLLFYETHARKLGPPQDQEQVFRRKPNCMRFANYVLCANADVKARGTLWEFIPEPLGQEYAVAAHIPINRGAELPPIVKSYVESQAKNPIENDPAYWLGPVMTDAYAVGGQDGLYIQCFERACLNWPVSSTDPRDITIKPLGETARP